LLVIDENSYVDHDAFIQDGDLHRLHGAYMTDLVDEVDPDGNRVTVTEEDAAVLLEQLRLLGADGYHVVCFGNKPFDALVRYFDADVAPTPPEMKHATVAVEGLTLDLYRVWFYGHWGANKEKVPIFETQLQELDQQIE
jgi:hypothetical protein